MAKFVYQLQNVLDVKLKMENQAKTNFSIAAAALATEEEKLDVLCAKQQDIIEEYRKKSLGAINVLELKFQKDSMEYIKGEIERQKININNAKKSLEIARFALNEAIKDRKIHEKLKEKAFEEFVLEENAAEKKEIDQLVSFRYNGNGKEG